MAAQAEDEELAEEGEVGRVSAPASIVPKLKCSRAVAGRRRGVTSQRAQRLLSASGVGMPCSKRK